MDRRELLDDEQEALRMAMDGQLSSVWTAIPGIVISVNYDEMTVEVQPTIQGVIQNPDGSYTNVNLPPLPDVPIVFPSAGGFSLTLPIAAGDEVLVIFASRCIDSWWQNSGIGAPIEQRMHDLSDGFAIPGPRSVPKVIGNISQNNAQLRNDAGDCFIEIDPDGNIKLKAPVSITLEAPNVNVVGTLNVSVNAIIATHNFLLHQHYNIANTIVATGKVFP